MIMNAGTTTSDKFVCYSSLVIRLRNRLMRQILLCFLLLPGFTVLAAPQFSQAECITLNQQRLELRKQLRQPYDAVHGQRLQQELRELERLLARHCKKPVKTPPAQPVSRQNG